MKATDKRKVYKNSFTFKGFTIANSLPIGFIIGMIILGFGFYQLGQPEPFGVGVMRNPFAELFEILFWWYVTCFTALCFFFLAGSGWQRTLFLNTKCVTKIKEIVHIDEKYVLCITNTDRKVKLSKFYFEKGRGFAFRQDCLVDITKADTLMDKLAHLIPFPTEIQYVGAWKDLSELNFTNKDTKRVFMRICKNR